jgi:hypothetical protein
MVFLETGAVLKEQEKEQQKKEEEQKKAKQEEKKAKEEKEEATYVWTAKKGEKGTIEITIDQKGGKKTIQLTAPYALTIKEGPDKTIVVTSPHLELKKGEEGRWILKSDKLHVSGDVHTIKLDKGAVIHVKRHGEEGDEVIEFTTKAVKLDKYVALKLNKAVHLAKDINVHIVNKDGETKKVIVSPHVEVHTNVKVHPNVEVHSDAAAHADVAVAIKTEISKKLIEEIRESIKKLQEKDLDASEKKELLEQIEKVIAQMNIRLEERHAHDYAYATPLHTEPLHFEVIRTGEGEAKKDIYFMNNEGGHVLGVIDDEGTYIAYIHNDSGDIGKDGYEKLVLGLKERLPEGYKIEGEFDEEKDRFTVKIKSEDAIDVSSDAFKKMVKVLKEELEKIKK